MADRYLLESGAPDGYLLEDGTGVLLIEVQDSTVATGQGQSIMAIQTQSGMSSTYVPGYPRLQGVGSNAVGNVTVDAAGEAVHHVGQLWIDGGGSKTISSAGGKIYWRSGAVTFADAGTTLRVGIQDVSNSAGPAARGDGTFDVNDDLVGVTDTIAATAWQTTTMSTGTKTLAHGDMVAVVFNMISRAGADSVVMVGMGGASAPVRPSVVLEAPAATFTLVSNVPNVVIEFDDGTLGFIRGSFVMSVGPTQTTFNSGSTPDEWANIINLPYPIQVDGFAGLITAGATADHELILYSDALNTPVAERTVVVDGNQRGTASTRWGEYSFASFTMLANINYAIALRPTTANNVAVEDFTVSAAAHMKAHSRGISCYKGTRTNQTGAFTADPLSRLALDLVNSGGDDGVYPIMARGPNTLLRM